MKITYIEGNIFNTKAQVLVNPVNCVGVMGAGLAKQFKIKYPKMYISYKRACNIGMLRPGVLQTYLDDSGIAIINFPTKIHWRDKSNISLLDKGLYTFCETYAPYIESIAFPKLGCGLGGLNWETQVKPLMERYLKELPISVYIYT